MDLHFEVSGTGAVPLLCIHGWGCDGSQFSALAKLLENDFRIYRLDLPGHGRTPLDDFSPSFERYADVIIEFARKQNLRHPVLLGHSMGGALAMLTASGHQLRPRAVISLDGSLPAAKETLSGQKLICGWIAGPDFRKRLGQLLRKVFFTAAERDARSEAIIQTLCAAPEAVLRFLPEQIESLHPEKILPQVDVPVLYLGGEAPRFDLAQAKALIPDFRFEPIPGAGHFLQVYAAEIVADKVRNFLRAERLL